MFTDDRSRSRTGPTVSHQSTHPPLQCVRIGCDGSGLPLIFLQGEIDLGCSRVLGDAFARTVRHPGDRIVVDARAVTFIDAGGISTLLTAAATCGRAVWLRAPSPQLRRIAELAGAIGPDRWRGCADIGEVRLA
ncbi:MAG: STAS domain-containing protein [Acidimicrobiia bacterium]